MADYLHQVKEAEVGNNDNLNPDYLIENMRADELTYQIFYQRFVRCIVGKKSFDYMIAQADEDTKESDVVTTSDEALALVAYENGYNNWSDVWEKSDGKVKAIRKTEDYPKEWISVVPTKYTTRTDADGKTKEHSDKSWSAEGIERFNELVKRVRKDRKEHRGWFASFVTMAQDSVAQKCVRHENSKQAHFPDAIHELFHDPESSNPHAFSPEKRDSRSRSKKNIDYDDDDSD